MDGNETEQVSSSLRPARLPRGEPWGPLTAEERIAYPFLCTPPPEGRLLGESLGAFLSGGRDLNKRRVKESGRTNPSISVLGDGEQLMESLILAQDKRWRRA